MLNFSPNKITASMGTIIIANAENGYAIVKGILCKIYSQKTVAKAYTVRAKYNHGINIAFIIPSIKLNAPSVDIDKAVFLNRIWPSDIKNAKDTNCNIWIKFNNFLLLRL